MAETLPKIETAGVLRQDRAEREREVEMRRERFYRECIEGREDFSVEDKAAVRKAMEARPGGVWTSYDGETVRLKEMFRFRDRLVLTFDISRLTGISESYVLGDSVNEFVPLPFEKKVRKSSRPKTTGSLRNS